MGRKIKFRVWDIANQSWSDLFHAITDDGALWHLPNDGLAERDDPAQYIVEQYIGLKDENGEEIYEGDIVTLNGYWEEVEPEDCQVIYFEDGCFRVGDGFENEVGGYLKDFRIVGNIHENPELLGEAK